MRSSAAALGLLVLPLSAATHLAVAVVAAFIASPVVGHHSAVIFDTNSAVAFTGTVVRYDWTNPHVYIYVETRTDTGDPVVWQLETDATSILARSGWTSESLTAGDEVVIRANPEKNTERSHALLVSLATEDGIVLTARSGGRAALIGATDLSGVWDGLRGTATRRFIYGALTEKGRAVQAQYSESKNPVSDCVPFPLPSIVAAPYLNEIEIRADRILIRSELFNVERTIYMDGREHPTNGHRTNQGHSIGWWEGDVLVVDTTLFADNRAGNRSGIASGAEKHVVERFELNEDGTEVAIEFVVEDPEYLAEPMIGGIVWDHAPDREFEPFGCDPEIAKRYTFE